MEKQKKKEKSWNFPRLAAGIEGACYSYSREEEDKEDFSSVDGQIAR